MNVILIGGRKSKSRTQFEFSLNNSKNDDPFYSQSNIEYLEKVTSEIDSGVAKLEEHQLIEI